jgi:archaellum biogenesis ATPase FlaH
MKYILKPLKINETDDLGRLGLNVMQEPKLRICNGRVKNGKTALGYKLLHGILQQPSVFCKPLYIALAKKKNYTYWTKKIDAEIADWRILGCFNEMPVVFPLFYSSKKMPLAPIQPLMDDVIVKNGCNFIIVDGFDCCFEILSTDEIKGLVWYLSGLVKNRGISVFITGQGYCNYFNDTNLNSQLEKWYLERPEYMGGDIVEWGDTRLTIE